MEEKLCSYGKQAGCKVCDQIIYAKCPKFATQHKRFLIGALAPFNFEWSHEFTPYRSFRCVYYVGSVPQKVALLKSAAVNCALSLGLRVVRFSLSRVLSWVIDSDREDFLFPVIFYLRVEQRVNLTKKVEEVSSCVGQFVDWATSNGHYVFINSQFPLLSIEGYSVK